jgi:hypothetical protein
MLYFTVTLFHGKYLMYKSEYPPKLSEDMDTFVVNNKEKNGSRCVYK